MSNIFDLANPGIQQLEPYAPGKPLTELQRDYGISDAIKLASNENPLGASPKAIAAVQNALGELNRYPDGNAYDLKQALSRKFSMEIDRISLGNGSNEILELMARTFVMPDQEIMFSQHSFAVYAIASLSVNAKMNIVPALPANHPSAPCGHDLNAMLQAINTNTRLIFIANPNNPTGTYLRADELYHFIKQVPKTVMIVLDQAYCEFVAASDYADAKKWVDEFDNLIVAYTFSKLYGLPALRIGYAFSSPQVVDLLNRVRQPFNTNSLAQIAASAALDDTEFVKATLANNQQGMAQICEFCTSHGLHYLPSVANFICIEVANIYQNGAARSTGKTGLEVYDALLYHGVIVRPIASYELPDYLRLTIGTADENVRFINALRQVLDL